MKKFLLPFPQYHSLREATGQAKYGPSRFVFRLFGSLEFAAEPLRILFTPHFRAARSAASKLRSSYF